MNTIFKIHNEVIKEYGKVSWCWCSLCSSLMENKMKNKFLDSLEHKKDLHEISKKIKRAFAESACRELRAIKLNDFCSNELGYMHQSNTLDQFFTEKGMTIRYAIIFIDELLKDRSLLHKLLGISLSRAYLIRMENHSEDFGNRKLSIGC